MALQLFDGSDSENDDISKIKINEEYARRFEHNKRREDLQRFEELKKKGVIDSPSPSVSGDDDESESESSDDDDDEKLLDSRRSDKELFGALIKVKNKDPVLKQKDVKLFASDHSSEDESNDEEKSKSKDKKEKKPMYIKDVMAKHLIEDGPEFGDEEEETNGKEKGKSKSSKGKKEMSLEEADFMNKDGKKTYGDEQEELKRAFLEAVEKEGLEDGEGDFLTLKEKAGEDKVDSDDKEFEEKLDEYFGGDAESNENFSFLRSYFKNKMWIDKNGEKSNIVEEDLQGISEDDMEIERQEEYEYRFQENPGDRVLGHSRKVDGSVRKKTNTRKEQRKSKEERMEIAQKEREEELKHLKNLKKQEIQERVKKIMKTAGIHDDDIIPLSAAEIEEEFDPEEYDRMMKKAFDEKYYNQEDANPDFCSEDDDDMEKPDFEKEDELLGLPKGWDACESDAGFLAAREKALKKKIENTSDDGDLTERENETEKIPEEGSRKRKRKTALLEKARQAMMDDYYKLDYEDTIGDLKTRFKYAKTKPNKFGMSASEILLMDDQELNQYVSLKKLAPYREEEWKLSKQKKYMLKMRAKELLRAASLDKKKNKKSKVDSSKLTNSNSVVENEKAATKQLHISFLCNPNPSGMSIMSTKMSLKSFLLKGEIEHSPLAMSDEQILEQIYSTHVHSDTKFDEHSLFTLVENTLKRSTQIVDNVVQGSKASLEHIDDSKAHQANFNSPLCTLRQISSEMSCKPPREEIAHKTTLAILNKLSHYEWDAKAVLTLAAFAVEYGEFWLLAQHQPTDPLAKSVAFLKRVPVLTSPSAVQKHRQAITELNNLVKTTLQVIGLILELENFATYDTKDVPALEPAREQIPVDVYWSIITVAAIVTQIDCLTTESEHKQELSHYGQKINIILGRLRRQITLCNQQIEEAKYYQKIRKLFQTPTEIMEVLKVLIFSKDAPQSLFDGATKTTVDISVLKKKNVYLFISTLDITEEEISLVRSVYDSIKTNEQYKIVWIPIVEEWNEQRRKKFEVLRSKMPWYLVHNFEIVAGYKYIKEEWHFKKKPMVVVLSPQGKVHHINAFHLIQAYGMKAFPFTIVDENRINQEINWLGSVIGNINPDIDIMKKGQKYIFFYGGHDKEWIQQFTKYATALLNDPIIKEAKIPIELFYLGKEDKSFINRFWSGIESLFVTKAHRTVDAVTQEVQKMLSYKNETGWALLSKGSSVVVSGHGTTVLKTVAEFEKWKEAVFKNGFDFAFKEYHASVVRTTHRCSHLEIPNVAGKLPETIKCPECPNTMEILISYKCCHNNNTANATH